MANGAAELIKILGNQFVQRLTIPTPSFNEYEEVIAPDGLNRFPLEPATFELDIDAFAESTIRFGSDTAVIVTPNNPTAISVPRDEVLRLARRLETQNCRLIVDESFIEFSRAGAAGSVEEMVGSIANLVVIKSMSKVFRNRRTPPWLPSQSRPGVHPDCAQELADLETSTGWLRNFSARSDVIGAHSPKAAT